MTEFNRREIRFRWLEIGLTMLVSSGASAIAVTWSMSAQFARTQIDIENLKTQQATINATVTNLQSSSSLQSTQIAVSDANYKNIIISLAELKEALKPKR